MGYLYIDDVLAYVTDPAKYSPHEPLAQEEADGLRDLGYIPEMVRSELAAFPDHCHDLPLASDSGG